MHWRRCCLKTIFIEASASKIPGEAKKHLSSVSDKEKIFTSIGQKFSNLK